MRISAAIITLNEEDRLEKCLSSLQQIVDEIVIVDSFSTDRTEEIARRYSAKFVQNEFQDYARQRNRALELCAHEWVLTIDADEVVSEELQNEIIELKKQNQVNADGFLIRRRSWYLNRWIYHCGWYPQKKVRLFKKQNACWQGNVHERLVISGSFRELAGEILHYTYRDAGDQIVRLKKYAAMQAENYRQKSEPYLIFNMLGKPLLRFIRDYFLKFGFLDGLAGLAISRINAQAVFWRYLFALEKKIKKDI